MPEQTLMQPQSLVRLLDFFFKKGMQKVHLTPILQAKRRLQLHSCKRRPKSHWRICSQGRGGRWAVAGDQGGHGFYHHQVSESWWGESIWVVNLGLHGFFGAAKGTMKSQSADRIQPLWKGHDAGLRPEKQSYQMAQNRHTAVKGKPSPLPQKKNITSQQLPFMLGWLYDAVPVNSPKLIILYQSPPENSWFLFPKLPKRIYLLTYCWGFILNWPSLLCVVFVHSLFQTSLRNPPIHPHLCKGRAMAFQESKVRTWIKVYILGES